MDVAGNVEKTGDTLKRSWFAIAARPRLDDECLQRDLGSLQGQDRQGTIAVMGGTLKL